jgi:group I intron endonuclease
MIGIYCIVNCANGKRYIGQSRNIKKRIQKHFQELRAGNHKNKKLQHAYSLHRDEFVAEILLECSMEDLDSQEVRCIQAFDSVKNGYNLEYGGNRHKRLSTETKEKIAQWNRGRTVPHEVREKIRKTLTGRKGIPMSEERRIAHSQFMTGKQMRLGKGGQKLSDITKHKMSVAKVGNSNAKGSTRTLEEIERLREMGRARRGRKYGHTKEYYLKRGIKFPDKDL